MRMRRTFELTSGPHSPLSAPFGRPKADGTTSKPIKSTERHDFSWMISSMSRWKNSESHRYTLPQKLLPSPPSPQNTPLTIESVHSSQRKIVHVPPEQVRIHWYQASFPQPKLRIAASKQPDPPRNGVGTSSISLASIDCSELHLPILPSIRISSIEIGRRITSSLAGLGSLYVCQS
jgi:hypothetical protein